ncbi:MAG: nucleotidyltransferase family protein [Vicinamibacterales bacterium]
MAAVTEAAALFVSPSTSMRDVIACIDRTFMGIALVIDDERRLLGTITDGDIRRALLAGYELGTPASVLLETKSEAAPRVPTTAMQGASKAELLELMQQHELRQIPLVDNENRVVGIELLSELLEEYQLPLRALVMAGGFGTRLRPLTADHQKSMLPVGDRPLLEVIVDQLQQAGIRRVSVATHFKSDQVQQHFGDGKKFGVDIAYINEGEPLGTAGALGLMPDSDEPILVMNGDILSKVNLVSMLEYHRANAADMTIAVRPYEFQVPYGVVRTEGVTVTAVKEKPVVNYLVNAGIYLLNGGVSRLVPAGQRFDMTDLIARAIAERLRVISFPLREYWLDIGRVEDYVKAVTEFGGGHDED